MSVSDIKNELTKMGLSTQTPGLAGEERMEELKSRLEQARGKTRAALSLDPSARADKFEGGNSSAYAAPPSIGDLTIAEIRSRLTALGENTSTPGMSGDDRRAELMKRLTVAICGSGDDSDESGDEDIKRVKTPIIPVVSSGAAVGSLRPSSRDKVMAAAVAATPPPKFVPPPPKAPPAKASPVKAQAQSVQDIYDSDEEYEEVQPVSQQEINELKKKVTQIR